MSDLAVALAALQADLPPIKRTQAGQHGKYAAYDKILAVVRPIMDKHGFLWQSQPTLEPELDGDRFVLRYQLTHLPSGLAVTGYYPLQEGPPQQQGAVITYARRYCLTAVLDLAIEGEDSMDAPTTRRPVRGARVTGAEHERTRYGLVEATPDEPAAERSHGPTEADDPWDMGDPEARPGSIGPAQQREMHALFGKLGITDRAERLAWTNGVLDTPVSSGKDLSYTQAAGLLSVLRERVKAK